MLFFESIMSLIETKSRNFTAQFYTKPTALTGKSKNKQDQTESCRLMRGAWNTYYEYIPELYTEPILHLFLWKRLDFSRL